MNVSSLLNWGKGDGEDYYALLGCDRSATSEQIMAEFRIRARELHPDKNGGNADEEKFKRLQQAKSVLMDASKRRTYDKWLNSGLSVPFAQWEALKEAVHTSLHWANPSLAGRMLGHRNQGEQGQKEPNVIEQVISEILKIEQQDEQQSAVTKKEEEFNKDVKEEGASAVATSNEECDPNDVYYEPKSYASFVSETGLRVESLPTEETEELESGPAALIRQESRTSLAFDSKQTHNSRRPSEAKIAPNVLSQREKQNVFALTRQDTGSEFVYGIVMRRIEPDEMRKKFRNYEI